MNTGSKARGWKRRKDRPRAGGARDPGLAGDFLADTQVPEAIGVEGVGQNDLSGRHEGQECQKQGEPGCGVDDWG